MPLVSTQTLKTASMASGRVLEEMEASTSASAESQLASDVSHAHSRPQEMPTGSGSRSTLVEPGGSVSASPSPSPFVGSRHACCMCWTKCEMPQSLLTDPNVFVVRLTSVPEHLLQQQQHLQTGASASDASSLAPPQAHAFPMRKASQAMDRLLKTKDPVSQSPIFFAADPPGPPSPAEPAAPASDTSANTSSNNSLSEQQQFVPLSIENYGLLAPPRNPFASGEEARSGLQWPQTTAAVVLSAARPDTSAIGRLRLLQEILSIVDPAPVDLDAPIVDREKGQPQDVFTLRQLMAVLPPVLIDESLESLKFDWLE